MLSAAWLSVVVVLSVVVALVALVLGGRCWYRSTSGRCTSTRSMAGKTVIVTGGTAGIGKETVLDLMRRDARVIIACRNLEKGAKVAHELRVNAGGVGEVVVQRLDTSDLASVRAFAKEVLDSENSIHVLINNAGIAGREKRELTADGLELTMATNHFGHFLLTNLLLGRLKESAPSRIVTVSSLGHSWAKELDVNDLTLSNRYKPMNTYCVSKLCNVLFTRELGDRLAGTGVTANSLHPGAVKTDFLTSLDSSITTILTDLMLNVFGKDANLGAQTSIHLAVSEKVEGVTGRYFSDCKEKAPSELARRKDLATSLWDASVKAVKLQEHEIHC